MFGVIGQHGQNRDFPNMTRPYYGTTTPTELPNEDQQIPREISWTTAAHKEIKKGRVATSHRQDRLSATRMAREAIIVSWKRDPGENSPFLSTYLPPNSFPSSKMVD